MYCISLFHRSFSSRIYHLCDVGQHFGGNKPGSANCKTTTIQQDTDRPTQVLWWRNVWFTMIKCTQIWPVVIPVVTTRILGTEDFPVVKHRRLITPDPMVTFFVIWIRVGNICKSSPSNNVHVVTKGFNLSGVITPSTIWFWMNLDLRFGSIWKHRPLALQNSKQNGSEAPKRHTMHGFIFDTEYTASLDL